MPPYTRFEKVRLAIAMVAGLAVGVPVGVVLAGNGIPTLGALFAITISSVVMGTISP